MRNKPKARIFLENLQERVYAELGLSLEERNRVAESVADELLQRFLEIDTKKGFRTDIAKLRAQLSKELRTGRTLATRFEDPVMYPVLLERAEDIERAAKDLHLISRSAKVARPLLGTLPTPEVNAMTVVVPSSDEHIVIFNYELFMFALLLSKVVVKPIAYKRSNGKAFVYSAAVEDVDKSIAEDPEITTRFEEVVVACLVHGRPSIAPFYVVEKPYRDLASVLIRSMELFVMGHEYAHILSGHLRGQRIMASLAGLEIEEVKRSWSQEFEADALGLSLMLAAMQKKGMDLSLSFWGADFFFSCIDILERGASVIRTGDENERHQSSHPDPQSRRENLRALISKQLPEQESKGPIELARTLEHIIEELWKRTKSTLRKHHDSGQRLSAIWR